MEFLIGICVFLGVVLVVAQIFLFTRFPLKLLNYFSKGYYTVDWANANFYLWNGSISVKQLHVEFHGKNNSDQVDIKIPSLKVQISFVDLLFRQNLTFLNLKMVNPKMDYTNMIPAHHKFHLLPKRGYITFKNSNIENGDIYVVDRTMIPTYKIDISEISMHGGEMDAGCPIDLFFKTKYGRCKVGKGTLVVDKKDEVSGFLTLTGTTWSELAGLKIIPIPILSNKIDLRAQFQLHGKDSVEVVGTLRGFKKGDEDRAEELLTPGLSEDAVDTQNSFQFQKTWDDLSLPIDYAIKILFLDIFKKLKVKGLVDFTIHMVTRGFLTIFTGGEMKRENK